MTEIRGVVAAGRTDPAMTGPAPCLKGRGGRSVAEDFGGGPASTNPDAMFFDPERHAEALVLLASAYLSKGLPASAFPFADRRCRILAPGARDFLLRAESSRMSGFSDHARGDLESAVQLDPCDGFVNAGALTWGPRDARVAAAKRLVADENSATGILAMARDVLLSEGVRVIQRFSRDRHALIGWVVWASRRPLEMLLVDAEGDRQFFLDPLPSHPLSSSRASAANFYIPDDLGALRALEFVLDGAVVAHAPAPPRTTAAMAPPRGAAAGTSERHAAPMTVIVPVYEDFEATRACLEAATGQAGARVIVVDDASPNADLRDHLDGLAERERITLIRNAANLGFAGSVNKALGLRGTGDVLLLNADAWLPPGAIARLATIAHATPDIGTVTPFSNNGEVTSYPAPHVANPMPSREDIRELDAQARQANGDAVVDLPNGVGFCLYITGACLDAVGPLSEIYQRGYYEDVEFCLKARERGFRNVCAAGIFVGHAGSLSFGDKKRALVVRNLAVLETRFPGYRMHSAAFVAADPLRSARARIDELRPPRGPLIMLASAPGKSTQIAQERARALVAAGTAEMALHCAVDATGRSARIWLDGEGAPKSLTFKVSAGAEGEPLRAYIRKLDVRRVEIYDAPAISEDLLRPLVAGGARVEVICGDLEWFGRMATPFDGPCREAGTPDACAFCAELFRRAAGGTPDDRNSLNFALGHAAAMRPLDRMGEAFAGRVFKSRAIALDPLPESEAARAAGPAANGKLGVLAPSPSASIDRLILRLGRALARAGTSTNIVVIGRCLDDLALMAGGNTFVTGAAEIDEYERLMAQYGIGPLLLADRTAFFGQLDRLAAASSAPKAYFDWSFGALAPRDGDLSLDPRLCDEKAAAAIAIWLGGIYEAL